VADVRVILNDAQIAQLMRTPSGPVFEDILRRTKAIERYAKTAPGGYSKPGSLHYTPGRAPRRRGMLGGALSNSIKSNIVIEGQDVVGIVSANTKYAKYVHDGTRRMKARPFLVDAIKATVALGR
jgi:hypothetical protein